MEEILKEVDRISKGYSKAEIMKVLTNDIQVLVHPISIPPMMLTYLNSNALSSRQVEIAVSMAIKILAYAQATK